MTQQDDDDANPEAEPVSTVVMAFDAVTAMTSVNGTVIDIEKGAVLGTGGTAIVFRGRDTALSREVALKVLAAPPSAGGASSAQARFVDEARITAELEHPYIPAVHRLGVDARGDPCIVMKLVHGRTFAAMLAEPNVPTMTRLRRAVDVLLKVCDALAHAHAKRIVHCDLTPNNVMVGAHGEVLLMDWGLARRLGTSSPSLLSRMTAGTPAYMAPEQALMPDAIDERVDVWGVGALLYHALTLRAPRPDLPRWATAGEASERFITDVAQPDRVDPALPGALSATCTRALSRDPTKRHGRIEDLRAELAAWAEGGHLFDTRVVAAGNDVIREGEYGTEAFAIVRGRCQAHQTVPDGGVQQSVRRVLRVLGPGDVFGEVAALGGGPRSATVTALEECELLVVRADDLMAEAPEGSGAAATRVPPLRSFIAALVARLRDAEKRAASAEAELTRVRAAAATIGEE